MSKDIAYDITGMRVGDVYVSPEGTIFWRDESEDSKVPHLSPDGSSWRLYPGDGTLFPATRVVRQWKSVRAACSDD